MVLARQLANQPPSQLPLQRLTSEQMQQLQLQVQQDRQRQVLNHFLNSDRSFWPVMQPKGILTLPQLVAQLYLWQMAFFSLLLNMKEAVTPHGADCELSSGALQAPSTLQIGTAPALGQDGPLQSYMVDNAAAAARAVASAARPSMVSCSPHQLCSRPPHTAALLS